MRTSVGIEHIARCLGNLESLSIGIYDLEDFEFLSDLNPSCLRRLSLGATFSKKPRLRVIERFTALESLQIENQRKDIEVIGELTRLEDVTLRSITLPSLDFLRFLPALWSLDVKLGGTKNLADLPHIKGLKYLELWQISGLTDLAPISEITGLQFLFLQSLRNVVRMPDLSRLQALRKIYLENMKGLKDLTALENAPSLEEFTHVDARGLEPSDYVGLIGGGKLKRMNVGFGSERKNATLRKIIEAAGIEAVWHRDFAFT
jgi:hypothetical protein